jgi:membrane-associated protease RseP (regulator of RpoE activity)
VPDQELKLTVNNTEYIVITKPSPDDPEVGYMGIQGVINERRIKNEYSILGGAFFWIKGLVKWFYIINLIIGLMNLLPIIITDGGRMLKVALEKVVKNNKNADKVWAFIGIVFIFTLLFALLLKYSIKFLALFGLG